MIADPDMPALPEPSAWVQALVTVRVAGVPIMPWTSLARMVADLADDHDLFCFVRKPPGLRLRFSTEHPERLAVALEDHLRKLAVTGEVLGHVNAVYEPEVHRFGGLAGMALAHEVFGVDAACVFALETDPGSMDRYVISAQRTMSLVGAACEDRAEMWDVWCRLRSMLGNSGAGLPRSSPESPPSEAVHSVRNEQLSDLGARARALAQTGRLDVGLRGWLCAVTVFGWNQFGLPLDIGALTRMADEAVARLGIE